MMRPRAAVEAALRFAERRRREDDAARLSQQAPHLVALTVHFFDRSAGGTVPDAKHTRRIVVENAPALFLVPCGDRTCADGGHDLTWAIMRSLDAREVELEGEHPCRGSAGAGACTRTLSYKGVATYR